MGLDANVNAIEIEALYATQNVDVVSLLIHNRYYLKRYRTLRQRYDPIK